MATRQMTTAISSPHRTTVVTASAWASGGKGIVNTMVAAAETMVRTNSTPRATFWWRDRKRSQNLTGVASALQRPEERGEPAGHAAEPSPHDVLACASGHLDPGGVVRPICPSAAVGAC